MLLYFSVGQDANHLVGLQSVIKKPLFSVFLCLLLQHMYVNNCYWHGNAVHWSHRRRGPASTFTTHPKRSLPFPITSLRVWAGMCKVLLNMKQSIKIWLFPLTSVLRLQAFLPHLYQQYKLNKSMPLKYANFYVNSDSQMKIFQEQLEMPSKYFYNKPTSKCYLYYLQQQINYLQYAWEV